MAENGPGSAARSSKKRLARAKIKPTDNGIKSSKGRKPQQEEVPSKKQQQAERKKKLIAIGVGIFAVIMALSMTLPSLTYIFGDPNQKAQEEEQAEAAAKAEQEAAEAEDDGTDKTKTGVDLVDSNYQAVVVPLEEKLEENKDDLATLLNLGNDYVSWASEASAYASDEDGAAHVTDLYQKALDYYDRYLELNDSAAVKSSRAMVQLYMGDTDAAVSALTSLTEEAPDYGPAWVNLGMIYEYQGSQDDAKAAYQKAVEADPDNEYGSKTYANQRIAAMAAQTTDITDNGTSGSATADVSGGAAALEDALGAGSNQ